MRNRKEPNIGKKEVQISEAVSIMFGDFDLVVEAFKLTGIDMELGMSNQPVQTFYLLSGEFHQSRDAAVNGSIEAFCPPIPSFLGVGNLE